MAYNDLRKGRVSQTGSVYHIITVTRDRLPYFTSLWNARKLIRELKTLQQDGMAETLCYVVMPDHLHWLMELKQGNLASVMRSLKGRSARAIGGAVWQSNYFDHAIRADEDLRSIATIHRGQPTARETGRTNRRLCFLGCGLVGRYFVGLKSDLQGGFL